MQVELYIATLDGGKTKTVCAVLDTKGNVLSYASGGATGVSLLDSRAVEINLRNVVFDALERSGLTVGDIGLASFTVCDLDTEELKEGMKRAVLKLGFKGRVLLEPDYVGAYYLATHGRPGVAVIAGTGSIAYGEDGHGKKARAGGWGWLMGDEGSGIWIGTRALNTVTRAHDGTGEETSLLKMVCKEFDIKDCLDLLNIVYRNGRPDVALASRVSPLVSRAAEEGDAQAIRILQQAGHELGLVGLTVSRKLGLEGTYEVGCVGSVFKSNIVLNAFKQACRSESKSVKFRGPYTDYLPLLGPAVMAFKSLQKRSSSEEIFETIAKNLKNVSHQLRN